MKKTILTLIFIFFFSCIAYSQNSISDHWEGKITVMGFEISIMTDFNIESGLITGTMDIPQQGASGLELTNMRIENDSLFFELPSPQGTASFEGKIQNDSISGNYSQAGMLGTFILVRTEKVTGGDEIPGLKPFLEEEVIFYNDTIRFAGTLTLPLLQGRHPAVVMITGSGPQNRDEEIIGFKIFKIIAEHLTERGIAVLRYDDRGVGGSTGNVYDATTMDFARDVLSAVNFLKNRNDINTEQIGLIGHSEGGIVAPIAASESDDISFIVLLAGTGVTGFEIILEQTELIFKSENKSEEEIQLQLDILQKLRQALQTNEGWDELIEILSIDVGKSYDIMTDEQKSSFTSREDFITMNVNRGLEIYKNNWFRFFLDYDPTSALEKVKVPTLVIFGELDLQVPPNLNEAPILNALKRAGNEDVTVKTFSRANHLFQEAVTGSPGEYAKLKKEFIPGFLDFISDWILEKTIIVK
jgi:uncharacterized protein